MSFDKSQVQDKEKELKRDYRMLKDARQQSGVGWDESNFKLLAEPHMWDNLEIVGYLFVGFTILFSQVLSC